MNDERAPLSRTLWKTVLRVASVIIGSIVLLLHIVVFALGSLASEITHGASPDALADLLWYLAVLASAAVPLAAVTLGVLGKSLRLTVRAAVLSCLIVLGAVCWLFFA